MSDAVRCRSVLVVEDDKDIRENIRDILELEGYAVTTAADGLEGLHALKRIKRPCLILLDLMMPVMNGMQFLEEKGQNDAIATIPVCVITGMVGQPAPQGITGFMKKPFEIDALIQVVRDFCGIPNSKRPGEAQ